jgi:predicted ATPase/transcriptional regulator with XRE-family HTH domain
VKKPSQAIPNQRLRTERELRGWSQKYVAEQIGADHYYLSRWERGTASPSPYYRQKLCALFGKDARELGLLPDQPEKQTTSQGPASEEHTALHTSTSGEQSSPASSRPATLFIEHEDVSVQADERWTIEQHLVLTPLVGRDQEVANVCSLLFQMPIRLLTLTGMGGVGKTRLALQVADRLMQHFAHGACFVSLAAINDPALVLPAIIQALRLSGRRDQAALDFLKASLIDKHLLLLLDNFEQVVDAAPLLGELLVACPKLKMLVTSRTVLHIRGEHEFPVPPLPVPDLAHLPDLADLSHYASVTLFLQRAQASRPDFRLTLANAQAISEICVRLDGLPLALELAAARTRLLPPQALLARLEHRLQLLTGGARDAPARHQTLRDTIAWSYHLLDELERQLFRRLSIFTGGCTLEAVEAICAAPGDDTLSILDRVSSLLDKSLLQQTPQEDEEPRLTLLETLREFGLEQLAASGEMEALRRAHATYYLALAERAEPEYGRPEHALWLKRMGREHDNLRAAMQWALEQAEKDPEMETALRLGGALREFWIGHDYLREGQHFLGQALERSKHVISSPRAKALIAAANIAINRGDFSQGELLARQGQELYQALGDVRGQALALHMLQIVARTQGDYSQARALAEEALALFQKIGDDENAAWSHFRLARLATLQGEYDRTNILFKENVAMHRRIGNKEGMLYALLHWTDALIISQGDLATIRSLLGESLLLSRELDIKDSMGLFLNCSARLALSQGDISTARSLAQEQAALALVIGSQEHAAEALLVSGKCNVVEGNYKAARPLFEESLALFRKMGNKAQTALCLESLAQVAAMQENRLWAARLWGCAAALREAIGSPLPPIERATYEQVVAEARKHSDEQEFAKAWEEGRRLSPEQALVST